MSVQRIVSLDGSMNGWQARWHVAGTRYLSAFFAVRKHGGVRRAYQLARTEQEALKRRAHQLRRQLAAINR